MCGIAGWIAPTRSSPEERLLGPMLSALAHRGPDGAGSVSYLAARGDYRVVLGHRRLAIIDPAGAHQPMCDDPAGLALTFNGEIYNFRELRSELEFPGHPRPPASRPAAGDALLDAARQVRARPHGEPHQRGDAGGVPRPSVRGGAAADGERRALRRLPLRRPRLERDRRADDALLLQGEDLLGRLRRRQVQRS